MGEQPTLQSMTAFGAAEVQTDGSAYACEVKSLNSRYLEVNVRMPRSLMALETEIIAAVKHTLARGKVEVVFNIQHSNQPGDLPKLNPDVLKHYLEIHKSARQIIVDSFGTGTEVRPVSVADFVHLDGVLESHNRLESSNERVETHRSAMLDSLRKALERLKTERRKEGAVLQKAFNQLLSELNNEHRAIAKIAGQINSQIYANYLKKLENFSLKMSQDGLPHVSNFPEERFLTEISIMTDKCDIEEEITRLGAHIAEFSQSLAANEPVGRKLDFICQEMHREINTMSNKLVQSDATKHTLNLKQIVDKIRQQVQNIE